MKTKLTISVDSTADLTPELYEKYKIQTVSLGVIIGDKLYTDLVDVTPNDIYNAVEKLDIMPRSNATNPEQYRELFTKNKDSECHIHFSLIGNLSASYASAVKGAEGFSNVHVIDRMTVTSGTGLLAIMAREMDEAGVPTAEIVKRSRELVPKINVSFVVDTLKYLHKGGRVSGLKLLGANLLKIHPQILVNKQGYMVPAKKFRGDIAKVFKQYTHHIISSNPNANKDLAIITHSDINPAIIEQMKEDVTSAGFKRIFITNAGSVITCHSGRNTAAVIFASK